MQAPDTIPLDASIKSVAIVVSYARADEVCITLLIRNFVSFIGRNQTTYGGVPEHGYTFNPYASYACRTDAGIRNLPEFCFYPVLCSGTAGSSSHFHAAVVVQVMVPASSSGSGDLGRGSAHR